MKKLIACVSLFFMLIGTQLTAQSSSYPYTVGGGELISELDATLVSVSFRRTKLFKQEFYVMINYGQLCAQSNFFVPNMDMIQNCVGVKNVEGELIRVGSYIEALNLMEEWGWKLETIAVCTDSDGASNPMTHEYVFRKKDNFHHVRN